MAFFTAYVDESGSDDSSPCFGVGGVLSSASKWAKFEVCWQAALAASGVRHSHMKEFAHSTGEFAKWKSAIKEFEPQRQKFLGDLCNCLSSVIYSFGAIITRSDYEKIVPLDLRQDMGTPYAFLGRFCIARMGVWAAKWEHKAPINLVFERGQPQRTLTLQHRILAAQEDTRRQFRIGNLIFADKYNKKHPEHTVLPLQAADLVAYELTKHWRDLTSKGPSVKLRHPLEQIRAVRHEWNVITPDILANEVGAWRRIRDFARSRSQWL